MVLLKKKRWLVTGCAGFIGSSILEFLLDNDQVVVGLDNFMTGYQKNLDDVRCVVGEQKWKNFKFYNGDIRNFETCLETTKNIDIVLNQAALGSVPRSIADPLLSHDVNVNGFINMLKASVENKVTRFVYASSSSVYGDNKVLPKKEENIGSQLSPYAVYKYVNELYAGVFAKNYNIETIGLRYFNVFGRRQDPNGPYAAVIPLWFSGFLNNTEIHINGDGETSRDFCYVDNVVQMNILAGTVNNPSAVNRVYNVACGETTSLNKLFEYISNITENGKLKPIYRPFRAGDIKDSLADINNGINLLGYNPKYQVLDGLKIASSWYTKLLKQ